MSDSDKKLRVEPGSLPQLISGMLLMILGIYMPMFFDETVFPVLRHLRLSLVDESLHLLVAALLLVLMNVVRAIPHYIGVYWVVDAFQLKRGNRRIAWVDGILVVGLLLLTYWMIEAVNGIHYDFGLPAVLMTAIIILFDLLEFSYVSLMKRTLFVLTALISMQFLDIMPAASALPVGRGELSRSVKMAAEILGMEDRMNLIAIAGMGILLLMTLGLFFMIRDENKLREMSQLREANTRMQIEARESEIQNRTLKEMQYLVHDLKSPLSVARTLEGVLRLQDQSIDDDKGEIYDRLEKSLDQMSLRISQLLTRDHKESFSVQSLFADVMQQISIENYAPYVTVAESLPETYIYANQMLISRVLVNLIQNAVQAVPKERAPRILLGAERLGTMTELYVQDNGKGVPEEQQSLIWGHGFSGKKSSGLGLSFVKKTVEESGGTIRMKSNRREGTTIWVSLPEEGASDDSNDGKENHDPLH